LALVSSSERSPIYIILFCNFVIAKRCAFFTRFDFFNCFLDQVHGRGVIAVLVWVGEAVGWLITRPCALHTRTDTVVSHPNITTFELS